MKKIKIILLLMFLFIPDFVFAGDIGNFYINATILDNGDLEVEEYFNLIGSYNGMERIINYINPNANEFNSSANTFGGSEIHNGSGIIIEEVRAVDLINFDFDNVSGTIFKNVSSATSGDYGVYTTSSSNIGKTIRIFLPSQRMEAFYVKYKLNNMAVLHNDIGELGWNIFNTSFDENIQNFKVNINIPSNKNLIKVWAHGPLNGESRIISNTEVEAEIHNLNSNTALDIRVAFDKEAIINSPKKTEVDALDKIINYETNLADEANLLREELKKQKQKEIEYAFYNLDIEPDRDNYNNVLEIISTLNDIELKNEYENRLYTYKDKVDAYEYNKFSHYINSKKIDYQTYKFAQSYPDLVFNNDLKNRMLTELKEIKSKIYIKESFLEIKLILFSLSLLGLSFLILDRSKYLNRIIKNVNPKYIRDIPSDLTPLEVGLLLNKKITKNEISATILDLIRRKIIVLEKDIKNDEILHLNIDKSDLYKLSQSDYNFIKMVFQDEINIKLKKIKKIDNTSFLNWKNNELKLLKENKYLESFDKKNKSINGMTLMIGISLCIVGAIPFGIPFLCIYGFQRYKENLLVFLICLMNFLLIIPSIIINGFIHISIIFTIVFSIIILIMLSKAPFKIKMKLSDLGKSEKNKWYAFRNFLNDFSRMYEKEIPEVSLWEKYLVYATVFGISEKVLNSMKIKLAQEEVSLTGFNDSIFFNTSYNLNSLSYSSNRISNNVISYSKPNIRFPEGSSGGSDWGSSSSGSGGGGGFSGGSSGGGSFGGGSGGGRF